VSADYIHRRGQFRMNRTGELVDFVMPPYGAINYLNAEADLRDVPLGTYFLFFLNADAQGNFTRLATMQDQYTMDMGHGFVYRVDEIKLGEGKIETTKQALAKNQPDLGKKEWIITPETRVWLGVEKAGKLEDIKAGDLLLANVTGKTAANPAGVCTDIWVGAETHTAVAAKQWEKFVAFSKRRGVPGWIDKTEGNKVTVTLFSGDVPDFKKTLAAEFEVGKEVGTTVANDELRTWNPPVDREHGTLVEIQNVPTDCYGCSGLRFVIEVKYMLEGFRKGHCLRLFGPGAKPTDPPYGESLMGYGYVGEKCLELVENEAKEYPAQFPFRTDYANENLPWFKFKTGEVPPQFSEHREFGELVKVDAEKGTGQFRVDRTGDVVDFTLLPGSSVRYLGAAASLADIPVGTRCRFQMYQGESSGFTEAWQVSDDYSHLAKNVTSYRVEALKLKEGRIDVAWQLAKLKNYNGDMEQPPDIGHSELLVTPQTRVWLGVDKPGKLEDLKAGDVVLANVCGEAPGQWSCATEIWVGEETIKAMSEQQGKKLVSAKK